MSLNEAKAKQLLHQSFRGGIACMTEQRSLFNYSSNNDASCQSLNHKSPRFYSVVIYAERTRKWCRNKWLSPHRTLTFKLNSLTKKINYSICYRFCAVCSKNEKQMTQVIFNALVDIRIARGGERETRIRANRNTTNKRDRTNNKTQEHCHYPF